uniref:uncharacterized protein LOC117611951 n=1 Tax=Osmia lignaria TaxID=473952 RepID=UPI00147816B6|nr:uncharacterized protein LOC117611951 [Osmia lignaria]
MFAIQRTVTKAPRLLKLSQNQCRTLLCTPPRVRVPFAEKMVMGAILWLGIMSYPLYIACNINNYNARKRE